MIPPFCVSLSLCLRQRKHLALWYPVNKIVFLLVMSMFCAGAATAQTVYEGNAKGNAIEGSAVVESCAGCLNGTRVGFIGNGNANYLRIKNISVAATGTYTVTLFYTLSGSRSFTVQINNGSGPTLHLTGSSWTQPGETTFSANFVAGSSNSVGFFNAT